jgi:paired small multidrug resistance pump
MTVPDALGIFGSLLIVIAYFANLRGTLSNTGLAYSLLNLIGAALILFSLWWAWNLAAAVMEEFWAVISAYGIARVVSQRL